MNTPLNDDQNNLRYAEYVLGVLDADTRAAVAREIEASAEAALAVALWQRRLTPMTEVLPDVAPSEEVWTRIRQGLGWNVPHRPAQAAPFWTNARPWRWISLGAALVAAACVVLLLRAPVREVQRPAYVALMVSSIRQDDGVTDWTATMDLDRKQIVVVPTATAAIPRGRSTQLWLIPAGHAPISVGVFTPDTTNVLPLSPELLTQLGPTAALAVSVEPTGGSPTGQPTGPVVAKGAITAASAPQSPG